MQPRPPNVLFLMSDEHRPDVAGFAGNTVVRTPVLDELARTGVQFSNAYTPAPVCVPARQAMAAGQLPRTCRCEAFGHDLPPFSMTFAEQFSRYGYHTRCFGKLHHQGRDQMQGWMYRPMGDLHVSRGQRPIYDRQRVKEAIKPPHSGMAKWSQAKEIQRAGPGQPHVGHVDHSDEVWTQGLLDWARYRHFANPYYDRPERHEPLLLMLSLLKPHYPYMCAEERFSYYLNRVSPFIEHEPFNHPRLSQFHVKPDRDVSIRDLYRATAAYYGMIEEVDLAYGRTMQCLEELGENLDEWLIIYTSDHGEMLGEHATWEKQVFFEASVRVPLIIRPPKSMRQALGCEGRIVHENVNTCDLFATLCELCDLALPETKDTVHGAGLDSRSLVGLMRGETKAWHEQYHNETISQCAGTDLLIKRDALKYQWYGGQNCKGPGTEEVLFDLEADPAERENRVHMPEYAEALEMFRQRRGELGFGPNAAPEYKNAKYH